MNPNLIDIYVSEIGRRLPKKNREDIEAEIRSILQDMLDEKSRENGKPVDEEMTLEVLKTYGSPEKVAAAYLGERYLIGPRLYPIFTLVLRIVLVVTGILAAIGLGVALSHTAGNPINGLVTAAKATANFIASMMTALGYIVLIFAIIEWAIVRAGTRRDIKNLPITKEWDPRSLLKVSTSNQVKLGETIVEIVGAFAAIVIFNFYPQIIGFTPSLNDVVGPQNWIAGLGNLTFIPLLSEAFFHFVPYLTLVWALTIILDIILLRTVQWSVPTRVGQIGLKVVNIIIAAGMLGGASLLAVTGASLTPIFGDATAAQNFVNMLNVVVRVALWLSIFGNVVETIRAVVRLANNNIVLQIAGKE